jgi:hypothetical protein
MKAAGWAEISSELPSAPAGILRVYLPAVDQPAEVDWIEISSAGKMRRWDF